MGTKIRLEVEMMESMNFDLWRHSNIPYLLIMACFAVSMYTQM